MAEKDPSLKDQRRRGLAKGLMSKYTRELLTKHSVSAQNYYFQHSRLSSLLARKQTGNTSLPPPSSPPLNVNTGGEFDGSKGLDLNSVYNLSMGIEDETHSIGAFGSFINILRYAPLSSLSPPSYSLLVSPLSPSFVISCFVAGIYC